MEIGSKARHSFTDMLRGWIILSRPPFHTVGVLPFILGTLIAWRLDSAFRINVFLVGVAAIVLIMLSTYYAGEYYDLRGDMLSAKMERNTFSGGSQAIVKGMVRPVHAKMASYVTLLLAGLLGLLLQFHCRTGPWTIPLGMIGMIGGFFYSTEPVRWAKRGIGELLIGICYGWLPVAAGYYIQSSSLVPLVHWVSIPIACSIFNVILINEFPDYPADLIENKANIVVRIGKEKSALLYVIIVMLELVTFPVPVLTGISANVLFFYPVLLAISLPVALMALKGMYMDASKLELMCALTLCTNLLISGFYTICIWIWGITI